MSDTPDAAVFGSAALPPASAIRATLIARRLKLAGNARPLHLVATGRTGSGKTTLGNRLLGTDYFRSDGGQDCTKEMNHVQFPGGLMYSDLPGVCSDDKLENFNRAALGLTQVDDFPVVDTLAVFTFTEGRPPARRDIPADVFPDTHPPADLVLYVLAADKQFGRDDRRYLRHLLARHPRPVYVLNLFSYSLPTAANLTDIVKGVAAVHRDATGTDPLIVPIDCRTGDGLDDLLDKARRVLPEDHGELLRDLVADQERHTPPEYAAVFRKWLVGVAASAAVLPAGPSDREHQLHRLAAVLWRQVDDLRAGVSGGSRGGMGRYRTAVETTMAMRATGTEPAADDRRGALLELARRVRDDVPARTNTAQAVIREEAGAMLTAWQAEVVARWEAAKAAYTAFRAADDALAEPKADLERRKTELDGRIERLNAAGREFDVRVATFQHDADRHRREADRHRDQLDNYNDTIADLNAAGGTDPAGVAHMNAVQSQINRNADRLNRLGRGLDRQADSLNSDIERHQAEVRATKAEQDAVNAGVREYNDRVDAMHRLRNEWKRLAHIAGRHEAAFEWAKRRFDADYYPGDLALNEAVKELAERRASTSRRAADPSATADQLARLETTLLTAVAALDERLRDLRRLTARLRTDRAVGRALEAATADHYDTEGSGEHRGSVYAPLSVGGAAVVFAAAVAAVGGKPTDLDALTARHAAAIGAFPDPPTLDAVAARLNANAALFPPEFMLAVAGLVFAAEYHPPGVK